MPTSPHIEKLGNSLIYLSDNVGDFSKTKALKLLFLLEELSISKYGVPFFGSDFQLWQYGPVEVTVYDEFENGLPILQQYIKKVNYDEFYEPVRAFNDDEFSDNDILLLDEIVKFAKHKTANDIIKYTHRKGSLWEQCAIDNNILDQLESGELPRSTFVIDFNKLHTNNDFLQNQYEQSVENIAVAKFLKAI